MMMKNSNFKIRKNKNSKMKKQINQKEENTIAENLNVKYVLKKRLENKLINLQKNRRISQLKY